MKSLISDFFKYLYSVFVEGFRIILSLFDIVGIVLFFLPDLANNLVTNDQKLRAIGIFLISISFFLANFSLYRSRLRKQAIQIDFYDHLPQNANKAEMRNISEESLINLNVWLTYKGQDGQMKREKVERFFRENDIRMAGSALNEHYLAKEQLVRFYTIKKEKTMDGTVTIMASFVGRESGEPNKIEKKIDLVY